MRIRRNASYVVCAYNSEQNCCNIFANGTLSNVLCVSSYPTPLCRHCHARGYNTGKGRPNGSKIRGVGIGQIALVVSTTFRTVFSVFRLTHGRQYFSTAVCKRRGNVIPQKTVSQPGFNLGHNKLHLCDTAQLIFFSLALMQRK